jgi:hypothetical protein
MYNIPTDGIARNSQKGVPLQDKSRISPISPPAKLSRTPIRTNTLAFGLSGPTLLFPNEAEKGKEMQRRKFASLNEVETIIDTKSARSFCPSSLNVAGAKLRNRLIKKPNRYRRLYPYRSSILYVSNGLMSTQGIQTHVLQIRC